MWLPSISLQRADGNLEVAVKSALPTMTACLTRYRGCVVVMLLALAGPVDGQRAPAMRLAPANAALEEEFSDIVAIRELRDGRVLIADRRDNRVVVADLRTGEVRTVARSGSGPGEFRRADHLFAIGGDSTILNDPMNGRWLLLEGDRVVTTVPPDAPAVERLRAAIGADTLGRMLGLGGVVNARQMLVGGTVDSFAVLLVHRATGRADTVARLAPPPVTRPGVVRNPDTQVTRVSFSIPWWAASEQAILFHDGWVAIARLHPYRVDWRSADGRVLRGVPLPFTPAPMDEPERRAYLERAARRTGHAAGSPASVAAWPDELPPFFSAALGPPSPALSAAPDGRLLILRAPTAAAPDTHYDVVDRSGTLVAELTLPFNDIIAGFGPKSVYVVTSDTNGIQHLRRYPWP